MRDFLPPFRCKDQGESEEEEAMRRVQAVADKPFDARRVAETLLSASATVHAPSARSHQITVPRRQSDSSCEQVGLSLRYADRWLDKYLNGGLSELVGPIRHQLPSRLSAEQQQQLKAMVMTQRPIDMLIGRCGRVRFCLG